MTVPTDAVRVVTRTVTYRFWVISVLAAAGTAAGLVGQLNYLIAALPFLSMLALSYLDGWWPHPATVSYELRTRRAVEGDEIDIIVHATTDQPLPWLEVSLHLDDGLAPTTTTSRIDHFDLPAGTHDLETTVAFQTAAWGVRGPRALTITSEDRYGMTRWQTTVAITANVHVHPPTTTLQKLLTMNRHRESTGEHRTRQRGQGTELAEVRSARPGDTASSIHPRLSAQRGQPMVIERHPDRSGDVVLLIDATQDIGRDNNTTLRWAVQAALSINDRHQKGMDRVGIIDWGGTIRWLEPGLGRRSAQQVVDALLHIQATRRSAQTSASTTTATLPLGRLPERCIVLAISPGLSEPFNRDLIRVRQRGHQTVAIQPILKEHDGIDTPARIGRALHEHRRQTLTQAGIRVLPWDPEQSLGRVLAAASAGGSSR